MAELDFSSQCQQQSVGVGNSMFSTLLGTLLAAQCAISPPELWPRDEGETLTGNHLGTYDFIVVGAGSAGSVIASRLSENPNWSVLVLEAGGDPPIESEIPLIFFSNLRTNYTWNYFTEPTNRSSLAYENQVCYWPRGKMIGGTGGINTMLYVRGNREDYDNWEQKGNPSWGWDDVLPIFEKSIHLGRKNGSRGGLQVNPFPVTYPTIEDMIFTGAEEIGVPRFSFGPETGIGYTSLHGTFKDGRRSSTGKSYLAAAKDRPNLHVIKHAVVTKINFDSEGQRAIGVTFTLRDEHVITAQVSKEVVVSAGTIDSPKLLMLSGIGQREHLESLHIPVLRDLKVGDNLQDHLQVPVMFKLNENKLKRQTFEEQLDDSYRYLINQTGNLGGIRVAGVAAFLNTDPNSTSRYPDVGFHTHLSPSGTSTQEAWLKTFGLSESVANSIREESANHHFLVIYAVLLGPKTRGVLRLQSADPKLPPKMFPNYLDKEEDMETLLRGINLPVRLEGTQAFQEQGAEILHIDLPECDQFAFKSRDYWKCYLKYMTMTLYHMTGTNKMGPDSDPDAVVDSRLRVKGVEGLRVADASIMPDITRANTNAPTIMIAEKAAMFIAEDWGNN